jgi:hypothetical protein
MSDEESGYTRGPGRGRGRFAVAGHEEDQENRLTHLEDYLSDLIADGTLPPFKDAAPEGAEEGAPEAGQLPA